MRKGSRHTNTTKQKIAQGVKQRNVERVGKFNNQETVNAYAQRIVKTRIANELGVGMGGASLDRAGIAASFKQFGGNRDMYGVFGYKETLRFNDYYTRYLRQDIASRIITAAPAATWRRAPSVYERDSEHVTTDFEVAWNDLSRDMRIIHYLDRIDKLSGIGEYGVLVLGLIGNKNFEAPVKSIKKNKLAFLSVFTENSAIIKELVTNTSDPRFNQPLFYEVDLSGEKSLGGVSFAPTSNKVKIHWSRIIHIAEDKTEDEIHGTPRLRPIFNLLEDLMKVVGGSSEMFWQGAYRGLHINVDPKLQMGDLSDADLNDLNDEMDEYINGIRRIIRTQGVEVNTLDAQIVDPSKNFMILMDLISGATKVPKRILFGSERGELSSEQDEVNWNARITERQNNYVEPEILRPFIDRLIKYKILPTPVDSYKVLWPSLFELDAKRKADVAWSQARAIRTYVGAKGNAKEVIGISEFREKILGVGPRASYEETPEEKEDDQLTLIEPEVVSDVPNEIVNVRE